MFTIRKSRHLFLNQRTLKNFIVHVFKSKKLQWPALLPKEYVMNLGELLMNTTKYPSFDLEVTLCDENYMQKKNHFYRGKDHPTDVLSFRLHDHFKYPGVIEEQFAKAMPHLGEIFICVPYIERDSIAEKMEIRDYFRKIMIHGLAHLLGHDHQKVDDERIMKMEVERMEREYNELIKATTGISSPEETKSS